MSSGTTDNVTVQTRPGWLGLKGVINKQNLKSFAAATGGFAAGNVVSYGLANIFRMQFAGFLGSIAVLAGFLLWRKPALAVGAGINTARYLFFSVFGRPDQGLFYGLLGNSGSGGNVGSGGVDQIEDLLSGLGLGDSSVLDELDMLADDPDVLRGLADDPDVLRGLGNVDELDLLLGNGGSLNANADDLMRMITG